MRPYYRMQLATLLIVCLPAGIASQAQTDNPSVSSSSARFTVSEQTQIPGALLSPGAYSIRILDHLSDRMIVEVDGVNGAATHTTFIGLANAGIPKAPAGALAYSVAGSGKRALKGFAFANGTTVEFVYPKADAVSLAKVNAQKIPAIDPESEGRVAASDLSNADMKLVTLWMLSTSKVNPEDGGAGIKAERYQQVASAHPRPVLKSLPHTASYSPVLWVVGLLSLIAAAALRFRRPQMQP